MKNQILIALTCLIIGLVIGTSFKGCGSSNKDSKVEIEYVDNIVEIPVKEIVYRDTGSVKIVKVPFKIYMPSVDKDTGDTTFVETEIEGNVPIMDRTFSYETDSVSASGILSIAKDSVEGWLYPTMKNFSIRYTSKEITTTKIKKRTFGLYGGGGIRMTKDQFKAVNLGLDLAIKQRTLIGLSVDQPLVEGTKRSYLLTFKRSIFK